MKSVAVCVLDGEGRGGDGEEGETPELDKERGHNPVTKTWGPS